MSLSGETSLNDQQRGGSCILFGNVAGLYPSTNKVKVQYLGELANDKNAIIIALTESHLKSHILDAEISIPGFQVFRSDRKDHINKGGVITFIKEEYASGVETLASGCNESAEWNCLFLPVLRAVVVNVYRPPACPEHRFKEMLAEITDAIDKLSSPMPTIIMCGDFNFPIINWATGITAGGSTDMQRQAEALLEFMDNHCLQQMVEDPTRMQNILDLFITNSPEMVLSITASNTRISDHRLITVNTCIDNIMTKETRSIKLEGFASFNFHHKRIDWEKLDQELENVNWGEQLSNKCPDEILTTITEKLFNLSEKFIPKKGKLVRKSFIPRDRRILMRNRANINRVFGRANPREKDALTKRLEEIEFKLLESHQKERCSNESKAVGVIKDNPKYFFAYAKAKSAIKVPIGPLEEDGNIVEDAQEISQILQNQFKSVFSQPKFSETDVTRLGQADQNLCDIEVTVDDIAEAINKLSPESAPGPDGIPPVLLKKCVKSLNEPFRILWTESMRTGKIPSRLKLGVISPVHKNGPRSQAKNYRPITLTSHIIKIFERVLTKKLVEYLETNLLFNAQQHGFRKGRSCLSQLMEHYQKILNIMENGSNADIIYLDFAKAFDKVDHGILIRKLAQIGIGGRILAWIYEFLNNRQQIVKVSGSLSSSENVVSGVPL